jgi:hypothetical protein
LEARRATHVDEYFNINQSLDQLVINCVHQNRKDCPKDHTTYTFHELSTATDSAVSELPVPQNHVARKYTQVADNFDTNPS